MSEVRKKSTALYLLVYGSIHALVDACCALLVLYALNKNGNLFFFILLYNLLAFGLQLPFGWINDLIKKPVHASILGCSFIIISLFLTGYPLYAVILAASGNAIFHIGGGTIALNLNERKALFPGIFVAPGGIGLAIGIVLAKFKIFNLWLLFFLLVLACIGIASLKSPQINYHTKKIKLFDITKLIILFILISIIIRSMVGLAINFPWKSNIILLLLLTLSVASGKAIGGYLSDKFGWLRISMISLLISAPLLAFGANTPVIGIAGIFLFNVTMPVTLVAISNLLPGRPGFSFGLTTFALIVGAAPTFFKYKEIISQSVIIFCLIIISSLILFIGLKYYLRKIRQINKFLTIDQ